MTVLNIMDSAGGTVTEGRNKEFQAVYKLKGKVLNSYGMDLHIARNNKEVDDLISVLRCGAGKHLDIEKLKFDKIIILADADDDGKHIELLLTTLFHSHLLPLLEAGKIYISISPLYKVSITNQPVTYLNTSGDLAKFFANQISEVYKFYNTETGKEVTKLNKKADFISDLLTYRKALNMYANKYNIEPHILETVFVQNFDPETGDIDFGDRIEITEFPNGNVGMLGFYANDTDEHFVSVNANPEEFINALSELFDKLLPCMQCTLSNKKDVPLEYSSISKTVEHVEDTIKRSARISRLKGLGEINADELWETSLDPEVRRLVQIKLTEDAEEVVQGFMGKNPSARKEFLKEVFASAIAEVEEV